jgi:hypothetical protein
MAWPGFRDTARQLGLRASVSIPLIAGSGTPIAALNLYAHDPDPMTAHTTPKPAEVVAHEGRRLDDRQPGGSARSASAASAAR